MVSKKIYKKVAVSFVAAGFLVSGLMAISSETTINGYDLYNKNMTGDTSSNLTIMEFTSNATIANNAVSLTFKSIDGDLSSNPLIVELYAANNTKIGAVSKNAPTSGDSFALGTIPSSDTSGIYYVKISGQGYEGRVELVSASVAGGTTVDFATNTIDLIKLPVLDSVSAQSSSSLRLSYSSTSGSTMHYLGYRGTSSSTQSTAINSGAYITSTSSFDDTGLSGSTSYYYKVCASKSDISSTNAYSILCSTANSGTTSSSYVATTNTPTSTSTDTDGDTGAVYGGTKDETASTDTTSVVSSEVVTVDATTTSQTTTTVDDTTGTSEIKMESTNTETGEVTEGTTIKMSSTAIVEMTSDGGVKATETAENGDTNAVTVSKTGDASLESTGKDEVSLKVDLPAGKDGAKVKTDKNTGKMTAETKLESKDTGNDVKISVEIDQTNKAAKVSISKEAFPADIIQEATDNGATVNIVTGAPAGAGVTSSETNVLMGDGTQRVLRVTSKVQAVGVKTTFKSTRSFFAAKKSLTRDSDYSKAKTVEIIPTTQWQKFEDIVLFSGKRSLVLLQGGADIVIDGERVPMVPNEEYLLPLQIELTGETSTTDTDNEATYIDGKLSLTTGWNLVSLPVDTIVDDLSIFGDYSTSWKYSDKKWTQNPETLNKAEGIWFKMNSVNEVEFTGDAYEPVVADLGTGWSLIGTGMELTNFKSNNSLEALWTFQTNKWTSNPETIYAGQGFWIKK